VKSLYYKVRGQGKPLVLLHGFLETHQIWDTFAQELTSNHTVITFDLPGFGLSPLLVKSAFSLDEVATEINLCLKEITTEKIDLIGHSLGGYIALAMVEQAPQLFSTFGLFHSTAYADSDEKKESRTKAIDFVKRHGALAFTTNFVPPLFANAAHEAVCFVKDLAIQTDQATVIAYLEAMRDRPNRTSVLKNFEGPILFIAGSHDTVIRPEALKDQVKLSKMGVLKVFEGVGHMGMFEASEEIRDSLTKFLEDPY
jgi:pimeloyl-ACP methyl ester carboxylesterase